MIIYGSKSILLKNEIIAEQCPNCGKNNTVQMNIFQRYAHMFWIPLFGIGKTGISQCTFCKQLFRLKEMPQSIRLSYENLQAQTKTPLWVFTGTAVIVVLVILVNIVN